MLGWIAALVASSALLTWAAIFPLRGFLMRKSLLDRPNERSSHTVPTPRGAGLPIAAVTLIGFTLLAVLTPFAPLDRFGGYLIGAALVAAVSFVDDLAPLSAWTRLAAQMLAAAAAVIHFGFWDTLPVPFVGPISIGWFGVPLTLLWIIGLTNAYNFMDGIDGIAGTQALAAGTGWIVLGSLHGSPACSCLAALVTGGALGFLGHNWPPARIFMGDVGSIFLGYTFAVLPLMLEPRPHSGQGAGLSCLQGVLLVWPFVFDTSQTFLRRLARRENVFKAHRTHLYQSLVMLGWSHRNVTLLYGLLAAAGGSVAVALEQRVPFAPWLALVGVPLLAVALVLLVRH